MAGTQKSAPRRDLLLSAACPWFKSSAELTVAYEAAGREAGVIGQACTPAQAIMYREQGKTLLETHAKRYDTQEGERMRPVHGTGHPLG